MYLKTLKIGHGLTFTIPYQSQPSTSHISILINDISKNKVQVTVEADANIKIGWIAQKADKAAKTD